MKYFTLLLILIAFKSQSQVFHFKTIKKDTLVSKVNITVRLDKESKRMYISDSTIKPYVYTTIFLQRFSVANKYYLIDGKDSITSKNYNIEVFQGTKETYMMLEDNRIKYIYK